MIEIAQFDHNNSIIDKQIINHLRLFKNDMVLIDGVSIVVLFGSYSKGTYNRNSDIDIAVFVDFRVNKYDLFKYAQKLTMKYPYDIQVLIFNQEELVEPIGIIEEIVDYGRDITGL